MKLFYSKKGFTLLELLIVIGIMSALFLASWPLYHSINNTISLKNSAQEIYNALHLAQSRAINSRGNAVHGLHFNADSYVVFSGPWAAPIATRQHELHRGLTITTGAGSTITFNRLTGDTSDTTIAISQSPTLEKTIVVNEAGKITLQP